MTLRLLIGPVTAAFAEQYLAEHRQQGHCLAFHSSEAVDLRIGSTDDWTDVLARLPSGWQPDLLILNLPYNGVPPGLWHAPIPIIGLAADWNLLWHLYQHAAPKCDRLLTDAPGVDAFQGQGFEHARAANLFGLGRDFANRAWTEQTRDIDVLFVGSFQPAVQRERLPWVARLAQLAYRWKVVTRQGVFGEEYAQLLSRSRIVFNRSSYGKANKRAFEALAAGALLFQEAGNVELPRLLRDRQDCVYYTDDNLEELLEWYLENEPNRAAVARAGQARAGEFTFERLLDEQLNLIEADLPTLQSMAAARVAAPVPQISNDHTLWEVVSGGAVADEMASRPDLSTIPRSERAAAEYALALLDIIRGNAAGAEQRLRIAVEVDPNHFTAQGALASVLAARGRIEEALAAARNTLAKLDGDLDILAPCWRQPPCPNGFGPLRVAWERAGWENAGRPISVCANWLLECTHLTPRDELSSRRSVKSTLEEGTHLAERDDKFISLSEMSTLQKRAPSFGDEVRAKADLLAAWLHQFLADWTGDMASAVEAAVLNPHDPGIRHSLAKVLRQAGSMPAAARQFRRAQRMNPFDREITRDLFKALGEAGLGLDQRKLANQNRLLRAAAPELIPLELWIDEVPAPPNMLVSIIILCCNELAFTRRCLESVLVHTRAPYELILVDNGSSDETPAYLNEVSSRPGPKRVVVLRNETNAGFPAGCNQGLAKARGKCLVFLNNDTVVTPAWLQGLVNAALDDWPRVGAVGAVSNYVPAPQLVQPGYDDLSGLDPFAEQRSSQFAGRSLTVDRLSGFCLLVRREVVNRVGAFDERFGLGFFDDDDLGIRVRLAGFELRVALDVYIHHFGSRTFEGLGIDCYRQLAGNFESFKAKWGPERSAGYRLPAELGVTGVVAASTGQENIRATQASRIEACGQEAKNSNAFLRTEPPFRVSLAMIVKNEERHLHDCLASVADLVDETIIVDTGSQDRTWQIALEFGAKVYAFPWVDSFAAARNESLRHATGDWIFWMDADDRLDEPNRAKLRLLFDRLRQGMSGTELGAAEAGSPFDAYVITCRCVASQDDATVTDVHHVRLFRNHARLRWEHRIHEQILPAVRRAGGTPRFCDIMVHHVGYQDPALRLKKRERDLRLLLLELGELPNHPFTLFNLGMTYLDMKRPAEALPMLQRSLDGSAPADSIVRKLHYLIVQCHRQMNQPDLALEACRRGRAVYPEDAELLGQTASLLVEREDLDGARKCYEMLLATEESCYFASVPIGLRGYLTRHNLATISMRQNRSAEAEALWRMVVTEKSEFEPAWAGLEDLFIRQRRWSDLDWLTGEMARISRLAPLATLARARGCLERKEFGPAQKLLHEIIASEPRFLRPRVFLSHALLQEGTDLAAAERVLLDILALAPEFKEAKQNLDVVRKRRNGLPD